MNQRIKWKASSHNIFVPCKKYVQTCDNFPPSSFHTFSDISIDPVTTCCESDVRAKQVIRSACDTDRFSSPLSPPANIQMRTELSPSESTYHKQNCTLIQKSDLVTTLKPVYHNRIVYLNINLLIKPIII